MFLAAIRRPRFDDKGNVLFDGKLGVWALAEFQEERSSSKYRPRGTKELKAVNVKTENYRNMIIENVLPSIRAKWPIRKPITPIYVQHDNAPVHVPIDDEKIRNSGQVYGWDI